jgi:hypothetical protein
MAFIRPIEAIARKWGTVTPGRTEDYRAGVENPRKEWATSTAAAESAYETGVSQAIAKKRFGRGVKAVGTAGWQTGAVTKGTQRWGPGVTMAQDKYARGFSPYRDAIERCTLPPRYARRDPRNLERVKAVVNALSAAKEQRLGKV